MGKEGFQTHLQSWRQENGEVLIDIYLHNSSSGGTRYYWNQPIRQNLLLTLRYPWLGNKAMVKPLSLVFALDIILWAGMPMSPSSKKSNHHGTKKDDIQW